GRPCELLPFVSLSGPCGIRDRALVDGDRYASGCRTGMRHVLLIHGHPFNRSMWAPQVDALRSRYRIIAPDLRGYGQSSLPIDRETRLETFASDCLALMDALHIRTFALGGLSMGGQIALDIHRQAPERVEGLLLADTFAGRDTAKRRDLRLT